MFRDSHRLPDFILGAQDSDQSHRLIGCEEVLQPKLDRLLSSSKPHQHPDVKLRLTPCLGQIEVLLCTSLALQHVEPCGDQILGEEWGLIVQGAFFERLTLQHALQRQVVPALFNCRHGSAQSTFDPISIKRLLPFR